MARLITTLGPKARDELGMILPHEHVFVDLRTWDQPGYGEADAGDVIRLMRPEIEAAREAGVTAIVEPSTGGVGRRVDILRAVSEATVFPLVAPTGMYREPWLTPWARDASEAELRDWMLAELQGEIEGTGVQAGWIKISAGDDGITPAEAKVLRAAAAASAASGAAVGSHTASGQVVHEQLRILQHAGGNPNRFVWIHSQREPDPAVHLDVARLGAWIEYDGIGDPDDDAWYVGLVGRVVEAGLENRLLLSQDRGWFDPGQPAGGTPKPYTHLPRVFLPKLADAGLSAEVIERLVRHNPFEAFARA